MSKWRLCYDFTATRERNQKKKKRREEKIQSSVKFHFTFFRYIEGDENINLLCGDNNFIS